MMNEQYLAFPGDATTTTTDATSTAAAQPQAPCHCQEDARRNRALVMGISALICLLIIAALLKFLFK